MYTSSLLVSTVLPSAVNTSRYCSPTVKLPPPITAPGISANVSAAVVSGDVTST